MFLSIAVGIESFLWLNSLEIIVFILVSFRLYAVLSNVVMLDNPSLLKIRYPTDVATDIDSKPLRKIVNSAEVSLW